MSLLRRHAQRPEQWLWRRFWLPLEVTPPLDSAGFLNDASYLRQIGTPEPVPLDALAEVPCVVALGDPGLGKSHAVQDYAAAIAESVPVDRLVAVDLGEYGSREELHSYVFRTEVVEGWSGSGAPVYLILDSLDESPVPIDTVCGILLDELGRILKRIPRERLRLRIACRTAVMPPRFISSLRILFARAARSGTTSERDPSPTNRAAMDARAAEDAEGCVVVEIAVLRRDDVRSAAAAVLGGDSAANAFLDAVVESNVGDFAARPITLRALLNRRRAGRQLVGSQADLYRDLCRELSGASSARPGAGLASRMPMTTLEQRYRVAGRFAAALVFGNKRGVWCNDGPPPTVDLLDPRDCDGTERVGGVLLSVDAATSTREALNTALFTGFNSGPEANANGGAVASHQTFAEFMAADWVRACEMELPQVFSLLHDPSDPEQRVVPQLRQVAAWLASMRADVFATVASREPELLLASEVVHVPAASRAALIASLLERAGNNRLMQPRFGDRLSYDRLNHTGLAEQLGPILEDQQQPTRVRHLALEIARACRVESLTWMGAEIALDVGEPLDLRATAAVFVADAGGEPERWMLMPLVAEPPTGDEAEELRGAALWASWRLFNANELFTMLTHPRRSNWSGAYSIALREIAAGIDGEYVVDAARWLAQLRPGSNSGAYNEIVEAALCLTLEHLEDDSVRASFLTHIRRRLRRHMRLGDTWTGKPPERVLKTLESASHARRRLITALFDGEPGWSPSVRQRGESSGGARGDGSVGSDGFLNGQPRTDVATPPIVDSTVNVCWIGCEMPELFSSIDIPWAIETLAALPAGDARRATWREAIRVVFHPRDDTHLDAALRYRDDADVAHATREWSSHPTREAATEALASAQRVEQEAETTRALFQQVDATEEELRRPGLLGERITHLLSILAVQNGGTEEVGATSETATMWSPWAQFFFELVRDPETGRRFGAVPSPETLDELIHSLSADQLRCLVDAALAYLNGESAEADPYPPHGRLLWSTLHGGAAALFVARFAPARLSEVEEAGWRQWLYTLVQYTSYNDETDRILLGSVFASAKRTSRDALHEVLRDATDASLSDSRRRVNAVARRLAVSTVPVAQELARRAAARAFPPLETRSLLSELLREGGAIADAARTAAARLLAETPAATQRENERTDAAVTTVAAVDAERGVDGDAASRVVASVERATGVAAAAALITGDEDAGWAIVSSRLREDGPFAREVLLFAAEREHILISGTTDRLSAGRLSDLYQIVQREFPPESDPWHVGVYSPGPNDVIRQWRNALLTVLENRATVDAVDALARIAAASPERDWLVQTWLRATAALISARWVGTPPRILMEMARQPHLRQVQSGEQLLDILEESLARLQNDLQGELRSVVGLWDQQRPRQAKTAPRQVLGRVASRAPSKWRPKDEGHLANEVARHLRRDLAERGVIVGRELVVQVGIPGGAAGLRTDLDIRARPSGESAGAIPDIRVIIEVKGSWNDQVLTAMTTQLVEDYLDPHQVRHGMYLVGAYTCEAWEDSPEKRRSVRLGTPVALRSRLVEQACRLSNLLRDVRAVVLDVALPGTLPRSARRA